MNTRRRTTRTTRDQSTKEAQEAPDLSFLFEEDGVLPNIPPRPGYAQYWVRAKRGNDADARNLLRMNRRGWQPRPADSVPKAYQGLTAHDESLGGIISTDDLVLMERPAIVQEKVIEHNRKAVDDREAAVKRNIFRDHQKLGGVDTGFSAPMVEDKARVEKGVLLDDDQ